MDKSTRNSIQRATQAGRTLLERAFSEQLEGIFDILLDGTISEQAGSHLSERQMVTREKLVATMAHKRSTGLNAEAAVQAYLREAAFTTLNRFVALKMLEARDLVQECVSKGEDSSGFKEFTALAPGIVAVEDKGYRLYIETIFDEIKTHLCECPEGRVLWRSGPRGATVNRPEVFRSKTPDRVVQELLGMLTTYNAIRKTMHEAARRKELDPRRVSFPSATERVREATYEMLRLPTARLSARYEQMLTAIARVVVPKRPGRRFPRAVKIKMSNYPLKRRRRTG